MMTESFHLGRIAGIRVGINWSVLVIFALIAGGLYVGLPGLLEELELPPAAPSTTAVAALVTAVVFLLSLLAHELAHAVIAVRNGIDVEGITLWLFGGVAKLDGEASDPAAELRIAAVGPLVSVALAAAFGALAVGGYLLAAPALVTVTIGWLGIINLILAIFNLFPAAPLDGGRILRAFLWWRRGDPVSAAVTASRSGRVFGFVLIAVGLLQFIMVRAVGGLWLVLIGWFLTTAAAAEERHAQMQGALGGVRIGEIMTPDPTVVTGDLTIAELIDDYVFGHRYSSFPVVDADRPVGLITLNQVKQVPPEDRPVRRVRDVARSLDEVPVATPDDQVIDVLRRTMSGETDGRLLVIRDGRLVGIVSPRDLARRLELSELRDRWLGERH